MENQQVSFNSVLEAAGVKDFDNWRLEITDIDKFQRTITVRRLNDNFGVSKKIHLQKLKGKTIMNIAADMVLKNEKAGIQKDTRNDQRPMNGTDFFEYLKNHEMRMVREFQDSDGNQWVVYEVPRPNVDQRDEQKPEPDYWVSGDALDWQPGYQFNGSRWLVQKINLDDQERMVIQNIVHDDIVNNQFKFTNSENPFAEVKKLYKKPDYNSTWRLYQSIDGKFKHWIDIVKQPAYDRYYYKKRPLYFILEKRVTNKKNQVTLIHQDSVDIAPFMPKDEKDKQDGKQN